MMTIHSSWLHEQLAPRRRGRPVARWLVCPECGRRLPQSRFGRGVKRLRSCADCRAAARRWRREQAREMVRLREAGLSYYRIAIIYETEMWSVYRDVQRARAEEPR